MNQYAADKLYGTDCALCLAPGATLTEHPTREAHRLVCHNCGDHGITGSALATLRAAESMTLDQRALLAFRVRQVLDGTLIDSADLQALRGPGELPTAAECVDRLILHMGRQRPGRSMHLPAQHLTAALGTVDEAAARWVITEAKLRNLFRSDAWPSDRPSGWAVMDAQLTSQGWEHHARLLRDGAGSRHAFMAMAFNEPDIGRLFRDYLVPAAKATNFDLRTTDHAQKTAGSIDNRMRVELRTSRFVVCDLTHDNRGAYWEAGFAEGLGRPVFYLCRVDKLRHAVAASRPHFDIAHQAIIPWGSAPAQMAEAAAELKAMIRATLPDLARMEDPINGAGA